jgi:UDP-N-acetylmuramoyl-L-alanyl-D-glutamate--2,6-diaminopimelate ligase
MNFKELALKLREALPELEFYVPESAEGKDETDISELISDSRNARPGTLFACVRGEHSDGHRFAPQARAAGAAALLCESRLDEPLPQIICKETRRDMGVVASVLYGNPASKLKTIAMTGTNGKTTSTFMLRTILEKSGMKTGLLGTIYWDDGKDYVDAEHTTPEGSDLQFWLHKMVKNGCSVCVMEASSHAIVQGRLEGIRFDRAGFTNLTREHLDYHKTMENYFEAKRSLFTNYMRDDWQASINIDDKWGKSLFEEFHGCSVSYGTDNESAEFIAKVKAISKDGTDIEMFGERVGEIISFRLPMLGTYNLLNALQAISLCDTMGIPCRDSAEALSAMEQVPGRLERLEIEGGGTCIIDFAHSSDGLEKVLTAVRPVCKKRLIVVFGAGGDRDRSKRPLMGEIATRLADFVIITSDNPRTEDPLVITKDIEEGAKAHPTERTIIVDRTEAVHTGLAMLRDGDILVFAGRGPEPYQILKDGPIPLLDRDIVLEWGRINGKEVS